jgi:hypothetical protein
VGVLLSFRQKIKIDEFAPFTIPFLIYMYKNFLFSYRVRLPVFRKPYRYLFSFILISVMLFDLVLFFSPYTPFKSDSIIFTKRVAKELKKEGISGIYSSNKSLLQALEFYGIKRGKKYKLVYNKREKRIIIYGKKKLIIDVSKLNTT